MTLNKEINNLEIKKNLYNITDLKTSKVLKINCNVNGVFKDVLIDTGADKNYISNNYIELNIQLVMH